MRYRLLSASALTTLLLFSACNGGGSGGGGSASADVLIGDAPVDDLLSFSAVVQSVRLQRQDLSFTGDLVGSLEIEFLGLNGALAFLAKGNIAPGTYVAVEIGFVPGSYVAKADDSSPVTIVPATNTYLAPLAAPLVVAAGDYVRFSADLNLLNSLSGTVASGTLDFDPSGSCDSNDGSEDALIDELDGTVVSFSESGHTVLVDGRVGDPSTSIGRVSLLVSETTVLLDNNNSALTESAFFALLAGGTLLEAHGNLGANGVLSATRIELEDAGGSGGDAVARIRGILTALTPPTFALQITQIKDGADVVQPVLDGLPDPNTIEVGFDKGTAFLFDSGGLTDAGSLLVGQEVTVRFSAFATPPFPAVEVEIDDSPGFHGTLDGFAPDTLSMHLDAHDPAVQSGSVASASTPVTVVLGATPLVLDLPGAPSISMAELVSGLALELHGTLSGPPDAPVIQAERVRVRPGFLRQSVLANVAAGGGNFVVDGGEMVDPFGTGVTPGPLLIWIEDGCTFEGTVTTRDAFMALYGAQASVGATLDVRGLASSVDNEIRAFAIRTRQP